MAVNVLNKSNKVNYYGIEVDPEVTWNTWEPGKKYTKKLVLKNVKFSTQKLNFCVPAKEVFTTTFPKTITLSAGTSFFLPITFKPHRKDVFIDKIDFQNNEGEVFSVPVKALLPQFAVELPDSLSCGTMAAHDVAEREVTVRNLGELATPFRWCCAPPYDIEPVAGLLSPFGSQQFIVRFRPQDVGTYTMIIPFLYGNKLMHQKTFTVTSVAKYPNISILVDSMNQVETVNENEQIVVDFGQGSVGQVYKKVIQIHNPSEVDASVEVLRADDTNPIDWTFFSKVNFSKVPGRSFINIDMEFRPKLALTSYVENFLVRVSNKCGRYRLRCVATTDGPGVSVSHSSLNFFQLSLGQTARHPLFLENTNTRSATCFQFSGLSQFGESSGVVRVEPAAGEIPPGGKIQLVLAFTPQRPIQYWRRLACLIPDQEPLFIDVLGTCHDLEHRPQIIQFKHITNFQKRQTIGLSYLPPETLMRYQAKEFLKLDEEKHLVIVNDSEIKSEIEPIPELSPWKEFFFSNIDTDVVYYTPYIGQDVHSVNFNAVKFMSKAQIKEKLLSGESEIYNNYQNKVRLKNNTKGTVILHWMQMQSEEIPAFSVEPQMAEFSPGETLNFTVIFRPNGSNKFFGAEIEAYAFYKSQRQFELVDENLISPPFCHTFIDDHKPFLPRFQFDRHEVVFPSVNTGEMAFRSLTLYNTSKQPMIYKCQQLKEPFAIKPEIGIISPNGQQIFTVNCEPKNINKYESTISMRLNCRKDFIQTLPILGSADNAAVFLDNNGQIYFPPTNIGNLTVQRCTVKNTSRILVKYTWKICPEDSFTVRVYPETGLILPNEVTSQQWVFSPKAVGRKVIKTLLMVQGISPFGSLTELQYFPLRIVGNGEQASIQTAASSCGIEFEPLIVGSSAQSSFEILNPSDATLHYRLFLVDDIADESRCIQIKDGEGALPARSRKNVFVLVRPKERKVYNFKIGYLLVDNDSLELELLSKDTDDRKKPMKVFKSEDNLATVTMTGVFPTLRITDVQATGSSMWISKSKLWANLSIDNFNVCLDSDPTTSELIYTVATRASFHRDAPVSRRAVIGLNLGAAPVGSESSQIRLLLENCGSVPTKFAFLMPQDLELELEYWAETGEYTEQELHQMKVQDNKLFEIEPRTSLVQPGENVTVLISYNHFVIGTDRLPVLFKLDRGREILLNFTGVTLDLERGYIHFSSNQYVLSPTPLGLHRSPVQQYELRNSGAVPVHYEVQLDPALSELAQQNYDIGVLQCLNPTGDILPGQTCRLEWLFTPIEARTYTLSVPIHLSTGECPTLQLTAIGYDQRQLGSAFEPLSQPSPGQTGVTSTQSIWLPGQLARLDYERLQLGQLPTFCSVRRLVFLTNTTGPGYSGDRARPRNVTFAWNVTSAEDSAYVYLTPQNGRLVPGESTACHVIIETRNIPRLFDINLICEIYDEDDNLKFRKELLSWEKEENRRTVEFTISDSKKTPDSRKLTTTETGANTRGKASRVSYLPPVLQTAPRSRLFSDQKTGSSSSSFSLPETGEKTTADSNLWFRPQMPKPFLLNFGISGRSCPIDEFQQRFPGQLHQFAVNKISMLSSLSSPGLVLGSSPTPGHDRERQLLDSVLSELLGDLLRDGDLLEAALGLSSEPVPHYVQLPRALETQKQKRQDANSRLNKSDSCEPELPELPETSRSTCSTFRETQKEVEIETSKDSDLDQSILESLPFGTMIENVMENMIVNILSEANNREVDLTARPRLIALPPRSSKLDKHESHEKREQKNSKTTDKQ